MPSRKFDDPGFAKNMEDELDGMAQQLSMSTLEEAFETHRICEMLANALVADQAANAGRYTGMDYSKTSYAALLSVVAAAADGAGMTEYQHACAAYYIREKMHRAFDDDNFDLPWEH